MSVAISKLVIKIGEKEIELSLAEARELLEILDDTLQPEKTEATKIIERIVEKPVYPWERPYRWWHPTVTYSTGSNTGGVTSGVLYLSNGTDNSDLSATGVSH